MRTLELSILLSALALSACDEESGTTAAPPAASPSTEAPTYYETVKPILDAKCGDCHSEGGIGPFVLETYEDYVANKAVVQYAIESGSMPPWAASNDHRELLYNVSLTNDENGLVLDWLNADLPMGDPMKEAPPMQLELGGLGREDLVLNMAEQFVPSPEHGYDQYRCFPVDWPFDKEMYVTGFAGAPDNLNVAHHQVVFYIPPEFADQIDAFDANDDGPGYSCFGGPTADGVEAQILPVFMGVWAPGLLGHQFPGDSGLLVRPGGRLVLQMHYFMGDDTPQPDQSGVSLRIEEEVEREGHYAIFVNVDWYFTPELMKIPAGETGVKHEYTSSVFTHPLTSYIFNDPAYEEGALLHSFFLHQHLLGKSIKAELIHADGTVETLVEIPKWDFGWQREYFFKEPILLTRDDKVRIECEWDNDLDAITRAGMPYDSPIDIGWGEGSSDEMCAGFLYLTAP